MMVHQDILEKISAGSSSYYIKKYNVSVSYNGYEYNEDDKSYTHCFTLKHHWWKDAADDYIRLEDDDDTNIRINGTTDDVISIDREEFHDALVDALKGILKGIMYGFVCCIEDDIDYPLGEIVQKTDVKIDCNQNKPCTYHYYVIYLEHGDKPNQFITSVKDEWMAKDLCKKYGFKYREVKTDENV